MRPIFIQAMDLLGNEQEDSCVRDAAAAMLSVALEAGLAEAAAPVLFRWATGPGNGRSWLLPQSLAKVRSETIAVEAIRLLRREDTSDDVRNTAIDVLSGVNAALVDDQTLVSLAGREAQAEQFARVVEAAHQGRGVNQNVLVEIRDRWIGSKILEARLGSIAVAALTTFSAPYWRLVIQDEAARVRAEGVRLLAKEGDPHPSVRIISEKVVTEQVNVVKAEMLMALGKLVMRLES